jgi:hypothetical protein
LELNAAWKVTVPIVLPPPVTLDGEKAKLDGRSAVTVNIPVFVTPFAVAVIFTCVFVDTECTVTDHWALDEPAVTVTLVGEGGTMAEDPAVTLSAKGMSAAAGALSNTVPVTMPDTVVFGENVTLSGTGGTSVRLADAE